MEEVDLDLDASFYEESINEYEVEFKNLLLNIYSCYMLIMADRRLVPANNENKIRDILLEYLKNTKIRNEDCIIEGYLFEQEVDEHTSHIAGRVDIKIRNINEFLIYEEHDAYFIIECKRLDGSKSLNDKYITEGIHRFTSKKYSSYYGVNGMIGFVVNKINIDENITNIGDFFNELKVQKLYESSHVNLKLYHLMMDFSDNIK